MTIAFFLQDLDGGGAERAIIRLSENIAKLGHNVDLVVGYASSDYRDEVSENVNLIDFATRSPFLIFFKLMVYLRRKNPDVIMSALDLPNIMLVLAAKIIGYRGRVVISQRAVIDASLCTLKYYRRIITSLLMRFCFPRADRIISNSEAAKLEIHERLGISVNKIFNVPNAVDLESIKQLASEPFKNPIPNKNNVPLIISVGSLTERKDMQTLIRAFAIVKKQLSAHLVILGKGSEQQNLEQLIAKLELSDCVHLCGFDSNPYKWIAAASVFVSASTGEGFPNVIVEALALSCPIVATDCPGDTAKILEHGKWGRLVAVGDFAGMAEAILATLNSTNLPDGSVRAKEFNPTKNAAAYIDVLLSH